MPEIEDIEDYLDNLNVDDRNWAAHFIEDYLDNLNASDQEKAIQLILDKFVPSFCERSGYNVRPEVGDLTLDLISWEPSLNASGYFYRDSFLDWLKDNFLSYHTKFYVDSVNGVDDLEHGLSVDKPWKTLHYASLHLPRYCYSDISLYVASGTYKSARDEGYLNEANNYTVASFYNYTQGVIYIYFGSDVKINGRLVFVNVSYLELRGKATFNFSFRAENYTLSNGQITATTYVDYIPALFLGTGFLAVNSTATFKDPFSGATVSTLITINGSTSTSSGYYRRGVQSADGGIIRIWSALVVVNKCRDAYHAYNNGRICVPTGAGTGNTNCFTAETGGLISNDTQGVSGTTAIVCFGGGRVMNGAMTSNGRY